MNLFYLIWSHKPLVFSELAYSAHLQQMLYHSGNVLNGIHPCSYTEYSSVLAVAEISQTTVLKIKKECLSIIYAEWNFPFLLIGPVHLCFKGCWVVVFYFIQQQRSLHGDRRSQLVDGWLRMGLPPPPPPPPREFCRHILSCRKLKAESFKRCLHSVLRGVSL